jgi:hypothetical protein
MFLKSSVSWVFNATQSSENQTTCLSNNSACYLFAGFFVSLFVDSDDECDSSFKMMAAFQQTARLQNFSYDSRVSVYQYG